MSVEWMQTSDNGLIALDGEAVVGRIMRIPNGSDEGKWMWAMIAVRFGPPFPYPRGGLEVRKGDAARQVLVAYEHLRALARPGRR